MNHKLHECVLRKYYYRFYYILTTGSTWIRAIYKPDCPMNKTHLSPIIFSVRKIANELLQVADKLEKELNDRC